MFFSPAGAKYPFFRLQLMDYNFWIEIWKNYCHIWNQPPQICHNARFHVKQKNFELETKNVLLGHNLKSYGGSLRIQSECGKMRTRITPNTDIFDAVHLFQKFFLKKHNMRRNYIIKSLLNLFFSFWTYICIAHK